MKNRRWKYGACALGAVCLAAAAGLGAIASHRTASLSAATGSVEPAGRGTSASAPGWTEAPAESPVDTEAAPAPLSLGAFHVQVETGRLRVRANDAWRGEVLDALALKLGFEFVDRARHHPFMTVDLEEPSIERLLARLVLDTPYSLDYEVPEDGQAAAVARLEIGHPRRQKGDRGHVKRKAEDHKRAEAKCSKEGGEPSLGVDEEVREPEREARPERERQIAREARGERQRRRHREYLAELDDPDPTVRAFAVSGLDADDPRDILPLGRVLLEDPDPWVRAEAATQLGFSEAPGSSRILVAALDDSEPDVLVAVIDALGMTEDTSVVPDLRPLVKHPTLRVSQAAESAIAVLGFE